MDAIENALVGLFAKLPAFPDELKNIIRKVLPWLLIIFGILGLLAWVATLGIVAVGVGLTGISGTMPSYFGVMGTYLIMPVQMGLAIAGGFLMMQNKRMGWTLAMYYELLNIVVAVLSMSVFGVLWGFVWLWGIFQIRDMFSDAGADSTSIM